jgi:hypothetical protein
MSEAYVIEIDGAAAGVAVRVRRSFRFYASDAAFGCLEGRIYTQPESIERAAKDLKRKQHLRAEEQANGVRSRASVR